MAIYKKIEVTRGDIYLGRKRGGDGTCCPIARAIRRQTRFKNIWVALDRVLHYPDYSKQTIADIPYEAQEFQRRLIRRQSVKPFSFALAFRERREPRS